MNSTLSASRLARQALQRSLAGPSSQRLALSTSSATSCACRSAAPLGPSISRSIARAGGVGAGELAAAARSAVASRWSAQQKREQASRPIRAFHSSPVALHGGIKRPEPGTGIKVTFRDSKGKDIRTVEVNEGDDLLSIAHEYDIDLEGACEGSIACSTCHVILQPEIYDKLEEPGDDENDMLDLAFALTDTSRLGCQVKVTKELDGMVAQLPAATRNMYVDGARAGHGN